jgi:hypothetical protein
VTNTNNTNNTNNTTRKHIVRRSVAAIACAAVAIGTVGPRR